MSPAGPERPVVAVSSCLLGQRVRWDGGHKRDPWVAGHLATELTLVPVCPEVDCGLGIPRPALVLDPVTKALIERDSGRDHSATMRSWAISKLAELAAMGLAGYILKARSPSCALDNGRGFFARILLEGFPDMPVVDESMLAGPRLCRNFVVRVRNYAAG